MDCQCREFYVTNAKGRRIAVIIDLKNHGSLWEDFYETLTAEKGSGESRVSLDTSKRHRKKKSTNLNYKSKFVEGLDEAISDVEEGALVKVRSLADIIK